MNNICTENGGKIYRALSLADYVRVVIRIPPAATAMSLIIDDVHTHIYKVTNVVGARVCSKWQAECTW